MKKNEEKVDIVSCILEEKEKLTTVAAEWGSTAIESYQKGIVVETANMSIKAAKKQGKKMFGEDVFEGGDKTHEALAKQTLYFSECFDKWATYAFGEIMYEIMSRNVIRNVTFRSNGDITIYKERRRWPEGANAIISYTGKYNVTSHDVALNFLLNSNEPAMRFIDLNVFLNDDVITVRVGGVTLKRNLVTGIEEVYIVERQGCEVVNAQLLLDEAHVLKGFVSQCELNEQEKVSKCIRVCCNEYGNRKIVVVPRLNKKSVSLSERCDFLKERTRELLPDCLSNTIASFVDHFQMDEGKIQLEGWDILELESGLIELIGRIQGELMLDGMTSRVERLLKIWKEVLKPRDVKKHIVIPQHQHK